MKPKTIPPLLFLAALVSLSLNCGTLDLNLVNRKETGPADPVRGMAQDTPIAGKTKTAPSETDNPAETVIPLPTNAASLQVHATLKTKLDYPGWHITWSPDGKWLILGERKVHFLDTQTLKESLSIQADRWVEGMAVSPDSKILSLIDESRGVMLFDTATGSELLALSHTEISTSAASSSFLAFSPDSATLAVIIGEVVKIFRVADGEELSTLVPKGNTQSSFFSANALAFSKDGNSLFVAGSGIAVMDIPSGTQKRVFGNDTRCMALSPDGTMLVTAGTFNNEPVTIWEAATGRQLRTLAGPTDAGENLGVSSMAFSPDSRLLATASADVTIKLWDVATGSMIQSLVGHSTVVSSLAFSPDGTLLASGTQQEGDQADTRLWTISAGAPGPAATRPASTSERPTSIPLSARAISPENAAQMKKLSILNVSESASVAWSPDGKRLVVSGRKLHFFDVPTMAETNALAFEMEGLAISPDSKILAAAGYGGVKLFNLAGESEQCTLPGSSISTSALSNSFLAFSPDSATLAVIIGDVVKLFATGTCDETGTIVAKGAFHIYISPDGSLLYAVGWGSQITVWDIATGTQLRSIGTSSISIDDMVLSPDGSMLATSSFDGTIILWETASGRQLHSFSGSTSRISGLAFTPDGRILATVADEVTIQLWDVSTGKQLVTLTGHSQSIKNIAFSSDGATLASSSYSDGVYLWGLPAG